MSGPKSDDPALLTMTVSAATGAELIGVSATVFGMAAAAGYIASQADGRYRIADCTQGYLRYRLDAGQQQKQERDSRLAQLRIASQSLALAVRRGELCNREAMESYFSERVGRLIGKFDSLPARVTRDRSLRGLIQAGVDAIRNEFAAECKRDADDARAAIGGKAA
jgi:hypothetical protein